MKLRGKILLLGSTGMAGHTIKLYLEKVGYQVDTLYMRIPRDMNYLSHVYEYDVVINCIGMLVKESEIDHGKTVFVNSYLPQYLAKRAKKLIHLSTDCVFDDNFYGRSKALGEVVNDKDLTLRMSIIGADMKPKGTGLFNWFMQQEGEVDGYSEALWNGITTLELAKVIDEAIKQDLTGLYSPLPKSPTNKYKLLYMIRKVFNKDIGIKLVEKGDDKVLVETRKDFEYENKSYEKMLTEMKEWIDEHAELYPQYR